MSYKVGIIPSKFGFILFCSREGMNNKYCKISYFHQCKITGNFSILIFIFIIQTILTNLILVSKLKINSDVLDLSIPSQLTQDSQQALLVHLGGVALLLLVLLDHLKQLGGVVNNLKINKLLKSIYKVYS